MIKENIYLTPSKKNENLYCKKKVFFTKCGAMAKFLHKNNMREIIFLFKLLLKFKIKFSIPKKKTVFFDDHSLIIKDYNGILDFNSVFILKTRPQRINEIFLTANLIIYFLKFLFKGNKISIAYFSSLIKIINPKLVITRIDNSIPFSLVAKNLHHNISFLAVQTASRYQFDEPFYDKKNLKKMFIPEFACHSESEIDLYRRHKIQVNKFNVIGSLKLSKYIERKNQLTKNNTKDEFDICLISEPSINWNKLFPGKESGVGLIASFVTKLAKKNNYKVIIAGKFSDPERAIIEKDWYKKYIYGNFEIVKNNYFSSYECIEKSNLVIGSVSTILREALALNKKVLSCNFTGSSAWDFPLKGLCFFNEPDFDKFEERVKNLLNLDFKSYQSSLNNKTNYIMAQEFKDSPSNKLKRRIQEILN